MRVGRIAIVLVVGVGGCGDAGSSADEAADATGTTTAPATTSTVSSATAPTTATTALPSTGASEDTGPAGPPGEFSLLTYNVAGLPQGISGSDPETHIPQISPLLNAYDLVLAQEDFWYHAELSADAEHPYQSEPYTDDPKQNGIGDGLNRFSQFPFDPVERVQWYDCWGQLDCASDCLARKGWSYARTTLAPGVEVDVYNLHMEAGGCPEDIEIRQNAAMDLVEGIAARSGDRAVIVGGDFNLRRTDPEDVEPLQTILDGAGLTDACDATDCGDERIDHILFRSGPDLDLEAQTWRTADEFVDEQDDGPLSDHLAVAVDIRYTPL